MKKFSLIELMIVVAIIAVLLSLLMPSLARASRESKEQFASNLKQLHNWSMMYSLENDNYIVSNNIAGQTTSNKLYWHFQVHLIRSYL